MCCRLVDEIVWVKMTVNRRMAKSHGYYLQHAKEVCLVGKKGSDPPGIRRCVGSDVIYSERRGQSQKPEEIYQLIEELVPNGMRVHNQMLHHACSCSIHIDSNMQLAFKISLCCCLHHLASERP